MSKIKRYTVDEAVELINQDYDLADIQSDDGDMLTTLALQVKLR